MRIIIFTLSLLTAILSLSSCHKSSDSKARAIKVLYASYPANYQSGESIISELNNSLTASFVFAPDSKPQRNVSWFRNGEKIVFQETGSSDIYVVNHNGTGKQKIGSCDFTAYLSPDGKRYFYKNYYEPTYYPNGDNHFYSCSLDGGDKKLIIQNDFYYNVLYPSWSSDGKVIIYGVYAKQEYGLTSYRICTVKADGTDRKTIIESTSRDFIPTYPQISPDGEKICYIATTKELIICDITGENAKTIFSTQYDHINYPYWAPDGQSIVFTYYDFNSNTYSAAKVSIDGSSLERFKNMKGLNFRPAIVYE